MKNLTCILCGKEHDIELVSHINLSHEGGLSAYLMLFPVARVVNKQVFTAVQKELKTGIKQALIPESISIGDKQSIMQAWKGSLPQRSSITIEE